MANVAIPVPNSGEVVATSWGASVAQAHNGIQAGTVSAVLANVNTITVPVVFVRPYAAAPIVVASPAFGQATWIANVEAITTTGFNLRVSHKDTGNFNATIPANWIAVGVAA
jgi:hypothetical protein